MKVCPVGPCSLASAMKMPPLVQEIGRGREHVPMSARNGTLRGGPTRICTRIRCRPGRRLDPGYGVEAMMSPCGPAVPGRQSRGESQGTEEDPDVVPGWIHRVSWCAAACALAVGPGLSTAARGDEPGRAAPPAGSRLVLRYRQPARA